MKDIKFEEVQDLLNKSNNIDEIFDKVHVCDNLFYLVSLNGYYNYVTLDMELLSPDKWFISASIFYSNGYAGVNYNGKFNYIGEDGNFLLDKWLTVDYANTEFQNGYAYVRMDGETDEDDEYNFIDMQGNYLFNEWLNYTSFIMQEQRLNQATMVGYAPCRKDGTLAENELIFLNPYTAYIDSWEEGLTEIAKVSVPAFLKESYSNVDFYIDEINFRTTNYSVIEKIKRSDFLNEVIKRQEEKWYEEPGALYMLHLAYIEYIKRCGFTQEHNLLYKNTLVKIKLYKENYKSYKEHYEIVIDLTGKTIDTPKDSDYEYHYLPYTPSLIIVEDLEENKHNIMDSNGKLLLPKWYFHISNFPYYNNYYKLTINRNNFDMFDFKTHEIDSLKKDAN